MSKRININIGGLVLGFMAGYFLFHPLSMVVAHPSMLNNPEILPKILINAFKFEYIQMAVMHGILAMGITALNMYYMKNLSHQKKRVGALESLLPICSYCKKIRDDSSHGHGKGDWLEVERYIAKRTDTTFTHGICPECYPAIMEEIDVLDGQRAT